MEASFEDWFVAQYGPRPAENSDRAEGLGKQLSDYSFMVTELRLLLEKDDEWMQSFYACHKAWQASKDQK